MPFLCGLGCLKRAPLCFAMEGVPTPRPLTHVLLHNILTHLHVHIGRVIITDMREDTFYATILLRQGNNTLTIDARPSDAIALALHGQAPVFATKKLLDAVPTVTSPRTSPLLCRGQNTWYAYPNP